MRLKALASIAALAACTAAQCAQVEFTAADSYAAYGLLSAFVRDCTPRNAGTVKGRLAGEWIAARLRELGADAKIDRFRDSTPDGVKIFKNVTVEFPAAENPESAPWIVFISHYDTAPNVGRDFQGANDGGSTTAVLMALAGAIVRSGAPSGANVMLAWTDGEEARIAYSDNDGFHGARRLVSVLKESKRNVKAVIGLDMLGDRDLLMEMPVNGTMWLKAAAIEASLEAGPGVRLQCGEVTVRDDFAEFLKAGYPAIDIIDFEFGPGNSWWHTTDDSLDKISEESLLKAGRLAAAILDRICQGTDEGTAK